MSTLEDVITYLEMRYRPPRRPIPAPLEKLALMRAEGVGAKLAARIVNELRDKVIRGTPAPTSAVVTVTAPGTVAAADAVSALVNLGYGRTEAFSAVAAAVQQLGKGAEADALIRAGLHELAR